jgi:putative redox protein
MVEMRMIYQGQLRCEAVHAPSGTRINTDAPKDNMGKGEAFSPTDLVGVALGTCMLTTAAIRAKRIGAELEGGSVRVMKEMVATPLRRIGKLTVELRFPASTPVELRKQLEEAALTCPVHKSLHPDVQIPVTIEWTA